MSGTLPFAPPPDAPARGGRFDLRGVARAAALALPVTALTVGARQSIDVQALGALPPEVAGAAAGACVAAALIGTAITRSVAWLLPLTLVIPIGIFTVVPWEPGFELAMRVWREQALRAAWAGTFDGVALWLWLGGRERAGVGLAPFLAIVGVASQLVAIGCQVVVPGLGLAALLALLPIVATRHPGRLLARSVAGIVHTPLAWLLAGLAWPFGYCASMLVVLAATGDASGAGMYALGLAPLDPPLHHLAEIALYVGYGLGMAVAAGAYDVADARTGAPAVSG